MHITFWGVRGSTPTPALHTWRYGGNTPCLEVRTGDQLLIFDAGTGIRDLGLQLLAEFPNGFQTALIFTHYHWDHIQGLPFFMPLYRRDCTINFLGPRSEGKVVTGLAEVLQAVFRAPFFPVETESLQSTRTLRELDWQSDFTLGEVRLRSCRLNHPQGSLAYRVDFGGSSFVYATDHEPGNTDADRNLRQLARGADLLIADAQYRPEQLTTDRVGWGHGSWETAARLALAAEARNLVLFHHEPTHSDDELDELLFRARQIFPNTWSAAEGQHIEISRRQIHVGRQRGRLSQRAAVRLAVQVEARQGDAVQRDVAHLENLSISGAYFLSPRDYNPQQPIELAVSLKPEEKATSHEPSHGPVPAQAPELRLHGTVLRTEPQTTNGHWIGVAVQFPGGTAEPAPAPAPAAAEAAPEKPAVPPKPDAG